MNQIAENDLARAGYGSPETRSRVRQRADQATLDAMARNQRGGTRKPSEEELVRAGYGQPVAARRGPDRFQEALLQQEQNEARTERDEARRIAEHNERIAAEARKPRNRADAMLLGLPWED